MDIPVIGKAERRVWPRNGEFRREESEAGSDYSPAKIRRDMAPANLRLIKDEQTTQNRARAAIEAYSSKFDERIGPEPVPVCKGRRLDVDAVLARSLAKVVRE